ncbi:MAG: hypothetical protein DHS20C15_27640 [Planctomycetota bacterium]|nr:MAG: hypothetical protein DHS20C15_27640 [Planctomycetota bacterium]
MIFAQPELLWLLLPLFALAFWRARRRRASVGGGSAWLLADLPRSWRTRFAWLPGGLALLTGVLLVLAAARPQQGRQEVILLTEGVDIQLVIDISSSMLDTGMDDSGQRTNLDIVREVVADFAASRENDRLGLVSFAGFPRTECPLTLDQGAILDTLVGLRSVRKNSAEDGTAIGSALGYAARKLMTSEAKSRVVVLLTDGQENRWDVLPEDAAALCADEDIRVYTIAAGRVMRRNRSGGIDEVELDTSLLQTIASVTGGRYFRARDRNVLEQVYEVIDELETSEREDIRYTEFIDLYQWLLIPALALLALELLLARGPLLELSA